MMGGNHLKVNFGISGVYLTVGSMLTGFDDYRVSRIGTAMLDFFIPRFISRHFDDGFFHQCIVYMICLSICFAFGTLLPDIDSKKSMLGRFIHIPFKQHRGWTHSVWFLMPFVILSIWSIYIRALCAGYFLHLLLDSVSAAGVCWSYPLKKYIMYPNGGFVAPGHKHKWYHAGSEAEQVLANCILFFCFFCIVYFGVIQKGLSELWFWLVY